MGLQLPHCVKATRIGHWSMGSENQYDAFGEKAPVTWVCACGESLTLEYMDYSTERYIAIAESDKAEFLASHNSCTAKCHKCGIAPVQSYGYWCEDCSENY